MKSVKMVGMEIPLMPLMPYLTTAARAHTPADNLPSINSLRLVCFQVTVYLCELHRGPRGTVLQTMHGRLLWTAKGKCEAQ